MLVIEPTSSIYQPNALPLSQTGSLEGERLERERGEAERERKRREDAGGRERGGGGGERERETGACNTYNTASCFLDADAARFRRFCVLFPRFKRNHCAGEYTLTIHSLSVHTAQCTVLTPESGCAACVRSTDTRFQCAFCLCFRRQAVLRYCGRLQLQRSSHLGEHSDGPHGAVRLKVAQWYVVLRHSPPSPPFPILPRPLSFPVQPSFL